MWTEVRKTLAPDHTRRNLVYRRHRAAITKEFKKGRNYHTAPPTRQEDPIEPPDQLPFSDTLSTQLLDFVRNHWSTIRTRVSISPLQRSYDYRLTTLDTTVLEPPLKTMFQEQTNAFNINLS